MLQRVAKGIYYRPRPTAFGESRPSPAAIQNLDRGVRVVFPAGTHAANILGFSTQNVVNREFATPASSLPSRITGRKAKVYTRRPEAWRTLSDTDAAILDFIRQRGKTSELSRRQTLQHLLGLLKENDRYRRLFDVAMTEPPRVRAVLGAIGQELCIQPRLLGKLHESLNPLSRFDFGFLSGLKFAGEWQAERPGEERILNEAI
jgi:hypothetical protein